MANYSVCTRCYPLLLLLLLLLLLQQHLLLYCLLYSGLFFIASFTPIADVSVENAPQSENFNYYFQLSKMVLRLFQFTFYTGYPCCFSLLSFVFCFALFQVFFFCIQQGVCFSDGIPICSTAGNQGAFSIAAYGFALIKFQAQICRDSPLSFPPPP